MKDIRAVLREEKGEKAHREAEAMGLKYKGFGYWVDPSTGQVTHKTEGDQLVAVDPDVSTEKAGPGGGDEAGGAASGTFGNAAGMGASFGTHMNKQNPTGMGTNVLKAPDPGKETANPDGARWDPGPDGDNMVPGKGQPKSPESQDLPKDTFVGKTNYYQWTAGPDGDSYKTLSFADMMDRMMNGDLNEAAEPGHRTMFRKMIGGQALSDDDPSHVRRAAQVYQDQSQTGRGEMMVGAMKRGNDTGNMNVAMDRLPAQMAKRNDKKQRINQLNQSIKELVQNPDYDMSQKGEELGSGMFGSVYDSKDGQNVIKEGKLTAKELVILNKLKDVKAFPNLINAEISSPFESANEIFGRGGPTDDSMNSGMAFFDDIPMADGKMVMSKMAGRPYSDASGEMTEEQKEKFVQKLWAARKSMHELGISHNDMHGENFFVDDAGNPSVLDLGLANDDPLTALMEALGGVSGLDHQLASDAKMNNDPFLNNFSFVPKALNGKIKENLKKVREMFDDEAVDYIDPPDDPEDPEDYNAQLMHEWGQRADELMEGGLRLKPDRLNQMREHMPFLEDNDKVLNMVKALYHNVQDTETGQRMSNAYDKLKKDRLDVARANLFRKTRGEEPIKDKLKDVLDPDD